MKNEVNQFWDIAAQVNTPPLYQVKVHNDDFTPMAFVVTLLESFFYMTRKQAIDIMMLAHTVGWASCGVFSKDFAEAKVAQVIVHARQHEHPLICSMEAVK